MQIPGSGQIDGTQGLLGIEESQEEHIEKEPEKPLEIDRETFKQEAQEAGMSEAEANRLWFYIADDEMTLGEDNFSLSDIAMVEEASDESRELMQMFNAFAKQQGLGPDIEDAGGEDSE